MNLRREGGILPRYHPVFARGGCAKAGVNHYVSIPYRVKSPEPEMPASGWRDVLRGHLPFEVRAAGVYRLLAIQGLVIVALVLALGFTYRGEHINLALGVLASVIATAALLRWRGLVRIAGAAEAMALVLIATMAVGCQSVLVATLSMPYLDPVLAGADGLVFPFLSWPDMARAASIRPQLMAAMCWVYSSLLWQPFVLAALLAAFGRHDRLWQFVHAWALALVACVAVFAFAPAVTAYVHYGFTQADTPFLTVNAGWRPAEIIAGIRSGEIRELGTGQMAGLIDFPSFHTAGAVLLAWGFREVPVLRAPFLLLNLAMIATVPVIGSHYFVDVVAGVAVAALAIAGSRRG